MLFRQAIYVFLSMLLACSLGAQDPYYINYTVTDGLPSDEVYDIEIDSLNQVWITTDRGVCLYNGYEFRTFTTKDGLSDNTNFEIYKDQDNRLWFNGYNQTLSYYENGKFIPYKYNEELVDQLDTNRKSWIQEIVQDSTGHMYGIQFRSYESVAFKFSANHPPTEIEFEIKKDSLWEQAISGNNLYHNEIDVVFFYPEIFSQATIYASLPIETPEYTIYKGINKIFKKNKFTGKIEKLRIEDSIENISVDKNKNLWVCTDAGLYRVENCDFKKKPEQFFKQYSVSSIQLDNEGNYWVGTNEAGVFFIPSFDFKKTRGIQKSTSKENFTAISSFGDWLVIGTSKSRIIAYDNKGNVEEYEISGRKKTFQLKKISKSIDGNSLLSGLGYRLSLKNDELLIEELYKTYKIGSILIELQNGNFLFSGHPGFIVRDSKHNQIFVSQHEKGGVVKNATDFYQDKDEVIWMGTLDGLFYVEDYDYQNVSELKHNHRSFGRISSIASNESHNKWISSIGNGLYFIQENLSINITKDDGLPSNMVNQVLTYGDSIVYLASNVGVTRLVYSVTNQELNIHSIRHKSSDDGLLSDFVNAIEIWDDKIWATTNNGVCSFDFNIFDEECSSIPVIISLVEVNQQVVDSDSLAILDHNENDVHLQFTSSSYRNKNSSDFYKYRLKSNSELSPNWIYTNSREIRYNDLPHGNYTFEVSTKSSCDNVVSPMDVFEFKIKPHFSNTFWFKALLILCSLMLVGLMVYLSRKRFLEEEEKKNRLREAEYKIQIAELNALRNQMNPHFVFNSLNSIQNFIFKKDIKKANYFLTKFSKLMRDSLQYTRLDFITLSEEIDFLDNYLELESMRFSGRFEYTIELDDVLEIHEILIPSLLLQPILENSVKHAFKSIDYKGLIEIKVKSIEDNLLFIEISDNGSGNQSTLKAEIRSDKHQPLGTEIIKDRMQLLNESRFDNKGQILFLNNYLGDHGYKVEITIPIIYS